MENGDRHGSHTNHDRDRLSNGINGGAYPEDKAQENGRGKPEPQQNVTPTSPTLPNGLNGSFGSIPNLERHLGNGPVAVPPDLQDRINQLPPEIAHITHGYMPLSMLLKRLAEKTHKGLTDKITELASMPVPASALNVGASGITELDDGSPENVAKKKSLLTFTQSTHADWVKALVITNWSRRSDDVSKTIDLKVYMDTQKSMYDMAIHEMMELKRGLAPAKMPNPDLKTALAVLSTGKAPWMPELNYIEPPPLTPQDLLKTLENLNTLLSIRLNLYEYDNIPPRFKDYIIRSGRVTFRVAGEFEIDLTIADEGPETQFWFIDFRFLFSPSLQEIPPTLRFHIESRVNAVLLEDGLPGCYKLLHEMVLTHKISEFRRQAVELAKGKWIDGIKVEALNRALSIQYWLDRYAKTGPKSWILISVHSGRRKDGMPDPKATSHLFIRWFRDGKEVKDAEIPFDSVNLSAESLLKTVIAMHVNFILTTIHQQLDARPLFADGEASLSLLKSSDEPAESLLRVQLTSKEHLSVSVEPITGRFIFGPASMMITPLEHQFNNKSKDPARDAQGWIESIRYRTVDFEITSHAMSVGWRRVNMPPLTEDVMKTKFPKDTAQLTWFQRPSWKRDWFMVVSFSMSGERWWLIETGSNPPNATTPLNITSVLQLPIKANLPVPTYTFLSTLNVFAAALLSHYANLKALHAQNSKHKLRNAKQGMSVKVPSILLKLSEVLPSKNRSPRTGKEWANDVIRLTFLGLEIVPSKAAQTPNHGPTSNLPTPVVQTPAPGQSRPPLPDEKAVMVTEARIIIPERQSLSILQENFDQDIAFDKKTGSFAIRLRSTVGEPVIKALVENFNRIEQFVDFINVLNKHKDTLHSETTSLRKLMFTYGLPGDGTGNNAISSRSYRATINFGVVSSSMTIDFDEGNPHLRIQDYLRRVLNDKQGLDGVATLLPLTLPALQALDSIEEQWLKVPEKGEALIFVRAVEWYIVRYNMVLPPPTDSSLGQLTRKVTFEIKLQHRKAEPWWYIRRTDTQDKDEIDAALKPIWNSMGDGWRGMRVSAVAEPKGAKELLRKVDEALRTVVLWNPSQQQAQVQAQPASAAAPVPAPGISAPVAPVAQMQRTVSKGPNRPPIHNQNQQRQQPTPSQSQSQSQSQGRNNPSMKREIVEID